MVSSKLRPLYRRKTEWAPGLVWTGAENLATTGNSIIINIYDFTTKPKASSCCWSRDWLRH
jgi:hypothetical protein